MSKKIARKQQLRQRRHLRIRKKVSGTQERPRLSVFRSQKHIQAQLVDDTSGHSLLGATDYSGEIREKVSGLSGKLDKSREVGRYLGQKALEAGITQVVFDRGGYLYHGRVKALAEGAREAGLKF
jgi:large subunit ribosomal protein L18